jgi:hypothetical protein
LHRTGALAVERSPPNAAKPQQGGSSAPSLIDRVDFNQEDGTRFFTNTLIAKTNNKQHPGAFLQFRGVPDSTSVFASAYFEIRAPRSAKFRSFVTTFLFSIFPDLRTGGLKSTSSSLWNFFVFSF